MSDKGSGKKTQDDKKKLSQRLTMKKTKTDERKEKLRFKTLHQSRPLPSSSASTSAFSLTPSIPRDASVYDFVDETPETQTPSLFSLSTSHGSNQSAQSATAHNVTSFNDNAYRSTMHRVSNQSASSYRVTAHSMRAPTTSGSTYNVSAQSMSVHFGNALIDDPTPIVETTSAESVILPSKSGTCMSAINNIDAETISFKQDLDAAADVLEPVMQELDQNDRVLLSDDFDIGLLFEEVASSNEKLDLTVSTAVLTQEIMRDLQDDDEVSQNVINDNSSV